MPVPGWEYGPSGNAEGLTLQLFGVPCLDDSASVVGLGAKCHLRQNTCEHGRNSLEITLEEYALLSEGTRFTIRADRGVGVGWAVGTPGLSVAEAHEQAALALLPDEGESDDVGESLPWHELARLISGFGISISPEELKKVPYEIELSPELLAVLDESRS